MHDKTILYFVKYPQEGLVKTRLANTIGKLAATGIYRCMLFDMLDVLKKNCSDYHIKICIYPPESLPAFKTLLKDYPYDIVLQSGENLGDKMKRAFADAFNEGAQKVIIIGSDIPEITSDIMTKAFDCLDTHDVIIGPTHDGGYYLLGANCTTFNPKVFDDITWSTEKVYLQTIKRLHEIKFSYYELETLRDVDLFEDLRAYYEANQDSQKRVIRTINKSKKNPDSELYKHF